jgi:hypothetical protein
MGKKALKDVPLQEVTLRKYEDPAPLDNRELIKKFCLSIGLLQPGDSRDIIVDILFSLLDAKKQRRELGIAELIRSLPEKEGVSAPNVRRQLRRLKELKMVEKVSGGYRITEFGSIQGIIDSYVIQFLVNPSVLRLKNYASKLDNLSDSK